MTVQAHVAGCSQAPASAAEAAGALVRRLQAAAVRPLRVRDAEALLALAAAKSSLVGCLLPQLGPPVRRLLGRLRETAPASETLVPAHGDFDADQLLEVDGGELVVLDFDDVCLAATALDLAAYLADVARGHADDLRGDRAVERPLLNGYGSRPPALDWYLAVAVLSRAPWPFQRAVPAWREPELDGYGANRRGGAGGVSVPRDPALPQLALLLDAGLMAPLLARSLGRPAQLEEPRIMRVTYKPRERVTVHYRVLVDARVEDVVARAVAGRRHGAGVLHPRVQALAARADGRSPQ